MIKFYLFLFDFFAFISIKRIYSVRVLNQNSKLESGIPANDTNHSTTNEMESEQAINSFQQVNLITDANFVADYEPEEKQRKLAKNIELNFDQELDGRVILLDALYSTSPCQFDAHQTTEEWHQLFRYIGADLFDSAIGAKIFIERGREQTESERIIDQKLRFTLLLELVGETNGRKNDQEFRGNFNLV